MNRFHSLGFLFSFRQNAAVQEPVTFFSVHEPNVSFSEALDDSSVYEILFHLFTELSMVSFQHRKPAEIDAKGICFDRRMSFQPQIRARERHMLPSKEIIILSISNWGAGTVSFH